MTRGGAVTAGGGESMAAPNAAPMAACWGLSRVLGAELPERSNLGGFTVDLCPCETASDRDAAVIVAELAAAAAAAASGDVPLRGGESAWRRRTRLVPRLVAAKAPPSLAAAPGKVCNGAATYVITGGLGGLGLSWLDRLTSEEWGGARRLVLASRSGAASGEAKAKIDRLAEATGSTFACVKADVAVEADVRTLLQDAAADPMATLRGVFHLAGLAGDGTIAQLTWAKFVEQSAAKIRGSHHLDAACRAHGPLDQFVLFTSIYGLLGNPQLSHYAAANSYQDGLAHSRRAEGLAGLAVSWGTWAGAGMAHRYGAGFERYWRSQGMGFIELDAGLTTLGTLMAPAPNGQSHLAHYAFMPAEWSTYARARGGRKLQPLTAELVRLTTSHEPSAPPTPAALPTPPKESAVPLTAPPPAALRSAAPPPHAALSAAARSTLGARLLPLDESARIKAMEAAVVELAGELDGAGDALDLSLPAAEAGLGSMQVVDLVSRLGEVTGLEVSPNLIYETESLAAMAAAVLAQMELPDAISMVSAPPPPHAALSAAARSTLGARLLPLDESARIKAMEAAVVELAGELDGAGDALDLSLPAAEAGLGSMQVVDLVSRLGEVTGLEVSPNLIYETESLAAMAAAVLAQMELPDGIASPKPSAGANGALANRLTVATAHSLAFCLPGIDNSFFQYMGMEAYLAELGAFFVHCPTDAVEDKNGAALRRAVRRAARACDVPPHLQPHTRAAQA